MAGNIRYQLQEPQSPMERLIETINLKMQPPLVQITIGATGGIFAGYLFGKTSKIIAALAGASFLIVQFCDSQGYIQINKKLLTDDLGHAKERLMSVIEETIGNEHSSLAALEAPEGTEWLAPAGLNKYVPGRIISGFLGGLLLGFGIS